MPENSAKATPAWLKLIALVVGPAAVMTAGIMGAGSTTALVLAGAWFRYDLLWVAIVTLPLVVVCLDSGARVGVMSGHKGMLSVIRDEIHPSVTWFVLLVMILFNFFVNMGQMSVMTDAFLSMIGYYPPTADATPEYQRFFKTAQIALSVLFPCGLLALLLSGGYKRAQKMMTGLLFFMFLCFLIVALKGLQDLPAILMGLAPALPPALAVPGSEATRDSFTSLMGIAGGALAAAPILSFSYFTSDDEARPEDLPRYFWKAVLSLGVIFGLYSTLVLVAGGHALYPLDDHARIDKVYQAGQVLTHAMPASLAFLGPKLFAAGLFACGMTTLIVVAQLMCYFTLDTLGADWRYTAENRAFKKHLIFWIAAPAIAAPLWSFPALLKILLLMSLNAVIVPLAIVIILYLINKRSLMGDYKANLGRNAVLLASLLFSVSVAGYKAFSTGGYLDQLQSFFTQ